MNVNTLERFDLGGPAQWALVRGHSHASPVLLLVQQGPGAPMINDAPEMQRQLHLEEDFRVVYWDQRGTGRSFDAKDRKPIALQTVVGDLRAMVRTLCQRLGVDVGIHLGELEKVFAVVARASVVVCGGSQPKIRLTPVGLRRRIAGVHSPGAGRRDSFVRGVPSRTPAPWPGR